MITKLPNAENGYMLDKLTSNKELALFIRDYSRANKVHCIICNSDMAKYLRVKLSCRIPITINNKVLNDRIFINSFV